MIDLENLQPTIISKDLGGKYMLLYGAPKVGKTTFATQIPNALLLAFEKGYQALPKVFAQDITKWSDFRSVTNQLRKEAVRKKFKTIVIDTADIAWDLCVEYICNRHGVDTLGDIAWGKGYQEASEEFASEFRKISNLGYGIVFISHAKIISVGDEEKDEEVYQKVSSTLPKRGHRVINGMVDLIGYIAIEYSDDGTAERVLYTRDTPNVEAGTRFRFLPTKIKFDYETVVEEIAKAIEMSANKADVVPTHTEVTSTQFRGSQFTYEELAERGREIWETVIQSDPQKVEENALDMLNEVEKVFGVRIKLSQISRNQVDLYEVLIRNLEDKYGLKSIIEPEKSIESDADNDNDNDSIEYEQEETLEDNE